MSLVVQRRRVGIRMYDHHTPKLPVLLNIYQSDRAAMARYIGPREGRPERELIRRRVTGS